MFYTGVLRALIVSAFLLLLVKTVDMVIVASTSVQDGIFPSEAIAKEEAKDEKDSKEKPKKEEKTEAKEGDEASSDTSEEKPVSVDEIKTFSESELEVLERLAERRERLLKWEKDLQIKENVLNITQEKIDIKIDEMRKLKKEVELALAEYRKEEDVKTKSLVKIYENMKPKNGADILSKMKVTDIIPIIGKMKEKNAAEILSKMDPKIAKEVTTKLNEVGRLRSASTTN